MSVPSAVAHDASPPTFSAASPKPWESAPTPTPATPLPPPVTASTPNTLLANRASIGRREKPVKTVCTSSSATSVGESADKRCL
ncbi:hypothetical protein AXF42_Ash008206 [Apostasia shenzhenica]|uniref:Uncharacterized protein n=1 Tax=Apostasia shenzhenica TaxID=1088818 RepID=A0A2I0A8W4_9ASPA|nr:hypothetical protein AXF42_Ash008206 [Apostasia shenzhenica]